MGSALLGGMLVALTITDIAAGAGLIGLAGKALAKTVLTQGASRALLKKSLAQTAKSTAQIAKNRARGIAYEKQALKVFNLAKNNKAVAGGSIPDSLTGGVITEIKNCKYLYKSTQFMNYAKDGRNIRLITRRATIISKQLSGLLKNNITRFK